MSKQNIFGITGIIIALFALVIAIFQEDIRQAMLPPPPEKSLGKELVDIFLDREEEKQTHDAVAITYIVAGIIGLILAIISYIKKESFKIAGVAGAIASVAILWQYIIIALVVAILILIFGSGFTLDFG